MTDAAQTALLNSLAAAGLPGDIIARRRWADCCSLKAGMGHVVILTPRNPAELAQSLSACRSIGVATATLGAGSNAVGSDDDDHAAVIIRLAKNGPFADITPLGDDRYRVGAAALLGPALTALARLGAGGFAGLSGIPGSIGGAAAMNAGANGQDFGQAVVAMEGFDRRDGTPQVLPCQPDAWSYRHSPRPDWLIVTSVTLSLQPVHPTAELARIHAERQRRQRVTPTGASAGSVFLNPTPELSAGKLIEGAGCKGWSRGPFAVSEQHANWIVNTSRQPGSAQDCRSLVDAIKKQVHAVHDLDLHTEWRFF
ncbi:MAG: FAD-binding protein [Lentisphaeria bacterium]|nr:FAD-binding protein [Lentisphaeria bacterium]